MVNSNLNITVSLLRKYTILEEHLGRIRDLCAGDTPVAPELLNLQDRNRAAYNLIKKNLPQAAREALDKATIKKAKPKLTDLDRSFWVALKQVFNKWIDSLIIVKPQTVVDWQNRRFKNHWTKISTKHKKP